VATYETEAIVLRAIRFSEADNILSLLTFRRGRVSAIAKGARRPKSRLGGRLQPGVRVHLTLHEGRGDVHGIRGAAPVEPHAGLWADSYRLLAASAILETAMRALPEDEPSEGAYHLTARALGLLARTSPRQTPPRLDPLVLGYRAKLLVAIGFLPQLSGCVSCGADVAAAAFSARLGGTLCDDCAAVADRVGPPVLGALRQVLGAPLADAEPMNRGVAEGVEHLISGVLLEHLGVALKSAASH
jgi:DNA repair protein RecO (recombination protein O)